MPTSAVYGEASPAIVRKWSWFVALGIVLIVLGIIAWLDVVAVTLASTIVIRAILLVGGAFQIVHSFTAREWRSFIFGLLSGVLYFIGGLLMWLSFGIALRLVRSVG
jgi:uncharacterized membrane protein HdeD (DUF308 family)